ncbi:MAG: hypothetical protein HY316_09770 [Acidobacteria bacterium]|nr:hypothetical protein [Acidobacteriota bacterium]
MSKQARKSYFLQVALLAGMLFAGSAGVQSAEKKTQEGTVSDAMCGVKHNMAGMSAGECTLKCAEMGSKFALVVGTEVYELDGKSDELKAFAGKKVKLTGNVDGKKIQVESVTKG